MGLRRTKDLNDFTIAATDADIGTVEDLYFDQENWTIRYLVVQAGDILASHKVLISPIAFLQPALRSLHIWVNLTLQQVVESPAVDLRKPLSRQQEIDCYNYYGWPYYWEGSGARGSAAEPQEPANASSSALKAQTSEALEAVHLRGTREVIGRHILATDGEIGHIEDFLFDDESWEIRYVIVDTRNFWPGKRVLLRPQWIGRLDWPDGEIHVDMSRAKIKNSPAWEPNQEISRGYELRLHQYYDAPPYWTQEK
jgi:sporulation protein YlmC with PRC-barrel domain